MLHDDELRASPAFTLSGQGYPYDNTVSSFDDELNLFGHDRFDYDYTA